MIGAGKDGVLYVFDRNNLGKAIDDPSKLKAPPIFFTFDPDQSINSYKNASPTGNLDFAPILGVKTHHLHGSPVYWKSTAFGSMLFVWGENGACVPTRSTTTRAWRNSWPAGSTWPRQPWPIPRG